MNCYIEPTGLYDTNIDCIRLTDSLIPRNIDEIIEREQSKYPFIQLERLYYKPDKTICYGGVEWLQRQENVYFLRPGVEINDLGFNKRNYTQVMYNARNIKDNMKAMTGHASFIIMSIGYTTDFYFEILLVLGSEMDVYHRKRTIDDLLLDL